MAAALSPPLLPEGEGHDAPDWVLLDTLGYIAKCPNATFAEGNTGTGYRVKVSFCTARPPHVSHFRVHIPGVEPSNYRMAPRVISAEANLVLFCLPVCPFPCFNPRYRRDYFLYRAHPRRPSLDLLPHPYPNSFGDPEVALLSFVDDDGYAVAALTSKCDEEDDGTLINETELDLHLYHSSKAHEGWTSRVVSVAEPLRDSVCPVGRGRYHKTTKVIALGGGMVGWVDLWRGILVCDVLQENPVLHDVPLPLPARGNWGLYRQSRPYLIRDITVSLLKGSIKYVEIEVCPRAAPDHHPPESYVDWFRQKRREEHQCGASCAGWKATAWSLSTSTVPSADWNSECTFHLADITVDPVHSELLPRPPHGIGDEATLLRQLIIGFPTLSMDDDVVYLLSKGCPKGLMEVVIAIDMRKKKVQGVAKLVTGKDFTFMRNCTSEVSRYLGTYIGTREA